MRLYLSGAISNNPAYLDQFNTAQDILQQLGYENIINPANICMSMPADAQYSDYMNVCRELFSMADALVQLPGWELSLGANRELGWAEAHDLIITSFEELAKGGALNDRRG